LYVDARCSGGFELVRGLDLFLFLFSLPCAHKVELTILPYVSMFRDASEIFCSVGINSLTALDSETKHNFGNPCEKRDKKAHGSRLNSVSLLSEDIVLQTFSNKFKA